MDKEELLTILSECKLYNISSASLIDNDINNGLVIRGNGYYGVAILYDKVIDVFEEFVGITIETQQLHFNNQEYNILFLSAKDSVQPSKLVYIALSFLSKDNREQVLNNTFEWIDEWKNIFGNAIKKYRVYDVIGELQSLYYLYLNDNNFKWMGPLHGSYDISGKDYYYEVKTSISKGAMVIKTSSSRQLDSNIKERLLYVSIEKDPYGESIDDVVKKLIEIGYSEEELENNLSSIGYKKGNQNRNDCYRLISIYYYEVNEDNFPIISLSDLNNYSKYKSIINYSLTLDLTGIPFNVLIEN